MRRKWNAKHYQEIKLPWHSSIVEAIKNIWAALLSLYMPAYLQNTHINSQPVFCSHVFGVLSAVLE